MLYHHIARIYNNAYMVYRIPDVNGGLVIKTTAYQDQPTAPVSGAMSFGIESRRHKALSHS